MGMVAELRVRRGMTALVRLYVRPAARMASFAEQTDITVVNIGMERRAKGMQNVRRRIAEATIITEDINGRRADSSQIGESARSQSDQLRQFDQSEWL